MAEEEKKEKFPSFRKAYQYHGGFDRFVYDTLAELKGIQIEKPSSEEDNNEKHDQDNESSKTNSIVDDLDSEVNDDF